MVPSSVVFSSRRRTSVTATQSLSVTAGSLREGLAGQTLCEEGPSQGAGEWTFGLASLLHPSVPRPMGQWLLSVACPPLLQHRAAFSCAAKPRPHSQASRHPRPHPSPLGPPVHTAAPTPDPSPTHVNPEPCRLPAHQPPPGRTQPLSRLCGSVQSGLPGAHPFPVTSQEVTAGPHPPSQRQQNTGQPQLPSLHLVAWALPARPGGRRRPLTLRLHLHCSPTWRTT